MSIVSVSHLISQSVPRMAARITGSKTLRPAQILLLLWLVVLPVSWAQASPFAYIINNFSNRVSVIDTESNAVTATVAVGSGPFGVAVNSSGTRVYVANSNSNSVSVLNTAGNSVIAIIAAVAVLSLNGWGFGLLAALLGWIGWRRGDPVITD